MLDVENSHMLVAATDTSIRFYLLLLPCFCGCLGDGFQHTPSFILCCALQFFTAFLLLFYTRLVSIAKLSVFFFPSNDRPLEVPANH